MLQHIVRTLALAALVIGAAACNAVVPPPTAEAVRIELIDLGPDNLCMGIGALDVEFTWDEARQMVFMEGPDAGRTRVVFPTGSTAERNGEEIRVMGPNGLPILDTGVTYAEVGICRVDRSTVVVRENRAQETPVPG